MYVCSSEAHLALSKSERVVDSVKAQEPSPESRVRRERLHAHKKKTPRTYAYRWRRGGEQIASWRGAGHLPCRRLRPSQRRSPSPASAAPGTANSARRGLPWPCLIIQGLNGCRWEKGDEETREIVRLLQSRPPQIEIAASVKRKVVDLLCSLEQH